MSRFNYVKYDERSTAKQEALKERFQDIETLITDLPESRYKSLCLTALEGAYAWTGKAIRDEQVARGVLPAHVPERG